LQYLFHALLNPLFATAIDKSQDPSKDLYDLVVIVLKEVMPIGLKFFAQKGGNNSLSPLLHHHVFIRL
jgi:hypothetical protein